MAHVKNFRTRTKLHSLLGDGSIDPTVGAMPGDGGGYSPPVGLGDVVAMAFGRGRIGVAIYAHGPELRLVIDGKHFDMLQPQFRAERVAVLPFVKKFTIWHDAETSLSFKYLRSDVLDDSYSGTRDILKFVSEVAGSRDRRLRFYLTWQAIQSRQDVTDDDVRARIEDAVKQSCQ